MTSFKPALFLLCASTLALAVPALAQMVQPIPGVTAPVDPVNTLSMHLRTLAANPRNLFALIGAGQAALDVGDPNAALGFFARAEEIDPRNPKAKAGLGSALVMLEKPDDALRVFAEAVSLGILETAIAKDRGLAYDLRGDNRRAQREYVTALRQGSDDEVTRRYALSLGISGDRGQALTVLDPLLRKQDQGAWRARAFILAMNNDIQGANAIARQVMPASLAGTMSPFLSRLSTLNAAERAHAVNFGTMPSDGQTFASVQTGDPFRAIGSPSASSGAPAGSGLIPAGQPLGRPVPKPPVVVAAVTPEPKPPVVTEPSPLPERRIGTRIAAVDPTRLPPEMRGEPPRNVTVLPRGTALPLPDNVRIPTVASPTPVPAQVPAIVPRPAVSMPAPLITPAPTPTPARVIPSAPKPDPLPSGVIAPAPRPDPAPVTVAPAEPKPATVPAPVTTAATVTSAAIEPTPVPTLPKEIIGPPVQLATSTLDVPTPGNTSTLPLPPVPSAERDPGIATPGFSTRPTEPVTSVAQPALPATTPVPTPSQAPFEVAAAKPEPATVAIPAPATETSVPTSRLASILSGIETEAESAPVALPSATEIRAAQRAAARKAAAVATAAAEAEAAAQAEKDERAKKAALAKANPARLWVQVATGSNERSLGSTWRKIRDANNTALKPYGGYSVPFRATNRVLAGPIRSSAEARALVSALGKAGVSASTYSSEAGQEVVKLAAK